jgi:hypothetical protein
VKKGKESGERERERVLISGFFRRERDDEKKKKEKVLIFPDFNFTVASLPLLLLLPPQTPTAEGS